MNNVALLFFRDKNGNNLEEGELKEEAEVHPLTTVTKIDPNEIPEVFIIEMINLNNVRLFKTKILDSRYQTNI